MRKPRVTVAMAMHNSSRYLRECLDSILSQSMPDFELLIVDDGSEDNSCEIVESYDDPRIRLIRCHHDFISSLNTLLEESKGDYIARMDSDDIMLKDRLKIQCDYLSMHPEVTAVCSCAISIDSSGTAMGMIGQGNNISQITLKMMAEGNCVCNPSSMLRRSVIENSGIHYNPDYCYAEDYRFWTDLLLAGGRIDLLPEPLIKYRRTPGQVTQRYWEEMKASADNIKEDLIGILIESANPGYEDPMISFSENELTLIIPFLNEGDEVENTIKSFISYASGKIDIIAINDASYDSYPYMERLKEFKEVTYILNRKRLGVAGSRDKGVALCSTTYFLLLDSHMRAYDDSWLVEIPGLLKENDNRLLCCQSRPLIKNKKGETIPDVSIPQTFGARLLFTSGTLMPGIEWLKEEKNPGKSIETIPAVLGAGYATSRRFWKAIEGLYGLREFGFDEQLISFKTWYAGGSCLLMKDVVLGHIYRGTMPYPYTPDIYYFNSLFISEQLFPFKAKCAARSSAWIKDKEKFISAFQMIMAMESVIRENREKWQEETKFKFDSIVEMNRQCIALERTVDREISNRLPEVYAYLTSNLPAHPGLYSGKLGFSIWLFHYASTFGDEQAAKLATTLLNDVSKGIDPSDLSFNTGMTGLIWGLRYLKQNNLITSTIWINKDFEKKLYLKISELNLNKISEDLCFGMLHCLIIILSQDTEGKIPEEIMEIGDRIANIFLKGRGETPLVYAAMLWKELRYEISESSKLKNNLTIELTDWIMPANFLPRNPKFWKLSLKDGILSSTIIRLIKPQLSHEQVK